VSGTQTAALFANIGTSWLAKFSSLVMLPLANEDLAIVAGAYIVVNDLMPVSLVALGIYGGMVASDFALYGIGLGARRMPWLGRYAISSRVLQFGETIKRNLFGLVALCRLVPGAVFVVFVACGWSRISFARFALAALATSAIYLPIVLYLVILFGDALDDRVGLWTWPLMFGALLVAGFMRQRVFAFREMGKAACDQSACQELPLVHRGMPVGLPPTAALGKRETRSWRSRRERWIASSGGRTGRLGL
jgi:membrane protein DedA with SNARE-associated domain